MRVIAFIEDAVTAHKILEHLGLPARAPPRGRSRESGQQCFDLGDGADHADHADSA